MGNKITLNERRALFISECPLEERSEWLNESVLLEGCNIRLSELLGSDGLFVKLIKIQQNQKVKLTFFFILVQLQLMFILVFSRCLLQRIGATEDRFEQMRKIVLLFFSVVFFPYTAICASHAIYTVLVLNMNGCSKCFSTKISLLDMKATYLRRVRFVLCTTIPHCCRSPSKS